MLREDDEFESQLWFVHPAELVGSRVAYAEHRAGVEAMVALLLVNLRLRFHRRPPQVGTARRKHLVHQRGAGLQNAWDLIGDELVHRLEGFCY